MAEPENRCASCRQHEQVAALKAELRHAFDGLICWNVDDGPAIFYLGTDECVSRLDLAAPHTTMLEDRERAIARALIDQATRTLDRTDVEGSGDG